MFELYFAFEFINLLHSFTTTNGNKEKNCIICRLVWIKKKWESFIKYIFKRREIFFHTIKRIKYIFDEIFPGK
jgi:hypothetical protein